MSNGWPLSRLNDDQMSNKVRVGHQPDNGIYVNWIAINTCNQQLSYKLIPPLIDPTRRQIHYSPPSVSIDDRISWKKTLDNTAVFLHTSRLVSPKPSEEFKIAQKSYGYRNVDIQKSQQLLGPLARWWFQTCFVSTPCKKMIHFDELIFKIGLKPPPPPTTTTTIRRRSLVRVNLSLSMRFGHFFPALRFFSFTRCHKLQFSSERMWKGTGVADGHRHLQEIYGLSASYLGERVWSRDDVFS